VTHNLAWTGGTDPLLDDVTVVQHGPFEVGRFGGATAAGALRNDDGLFVLADTAGRWECAAVLDAHGSDDSAEVVVAGFRAAVEQIDSTLAKPVGTALPAFQGLVLQLLTTGETGELLAACSFETAVLAVARVDRFLAWVSVGDNLLLLFHPELARLGQYQLNQRQFFEWVGRADSLRLPVRCYSSGTRELREGRSVIALVTDGLLEYVHPPVEPASLYRDFQSQPTQESVLRAMDRVRVAHGRDSATIVAWEGRSSAPGLMPSKPTR
jgi:hypothetical protein